ncbi:unnamed protein product [Rotaria socialis]|uniref:Phospholipase A-2-activating protein n=1 Tax=Rotaria socialis TaxID=392032 RepID=A0A819ZEU5_9BILA|nr:unnamed protein product [Rotaria socialis]CAF3442668.1 unnamed protein product [Rotaria socialis]CAF4171096.1 unnamed protein product [Rotaria socialis]CAF4466450.1 unnamed protein product [Rotaria socialis]
MANTSYRLRCQLYGHESDVRSVSTITEYDGIVSGSRDKTARIWRPSDKTSFEQRAVLKNHTHYIIATCYIPPNSEFPDGLIVTGGNDKKICVYSAKQGIYLFTLEGHEQTVSSLSHVPQTDQLLSGSWDFTGRIWSLSTKKCIQTLKGHSKAIWAIISMGDVTQNSNIILTGAADNIIMGWKNQVKFQIYEGHTNCVRSLTSINANEFLSCSNDFNIKRWNVISAQCLQTYVGHTSFVYSVAMVSSDQFASVSEDRSLRLWSVNADEPKQTIRLPTGTVWSVCSLTNNDMVVGSSDGRIFIFTKDTSRTATMEEIAAFEQEIASTSIQTKTGDLGEVKIDDLPNEDALKKPGTREGQTTMINKGNGHVEAYQWNMLDQRWMKIGDVVGSADSTAQGQASATGEKIMFEGQYYDYVFNVELDEGVPLKLPYNVTDDPWFAAQTFIQRHELSQMFLDQVAQFIITNTKGMVIDQSASDYVDPFTGDVRYVPIGTSPMDTTGPQTNNDPFTGTGRYVPNVTPNVSLSSTRKETTSNQDPFTGAGRYTPNDSNDQPTRPLSASQSTVIKTEDAELTAAFPQAHYITMRNADISKILGKLKDFNDNATGDGLRLLDNQIQQINELVNGNTNNVEMKLNLLFQLLKWPIDKIFPILDIIRLIILNVDVCKYVFENDIKSNEFITQLFTYLQPEQSANTMFIFRTLTNLFSNDLGEKYMIKNRNSILAKILICLPLTKKNTQIALTNVILNYCIYAYRSNDERLSDYLYECYKEFVDIQFESDGAKRLILGLGTLFCTNADLVLNVQTTSDNNAKRFFTALEKSASQLNADTLECFERCRALVKNL